MSVILIQDNYFLAETGGVWTNLSTGTWYNGSALFASKADATTNGILYASFQGTSISFVGVTPPSNESTTFLVDIDSEANYTATYPTSAVGGTWYTSPNVADQATYHAINLYGMDQIIADYVLVTAGSQTNLTDQTIFVDDSNPEIAWSGQWWSADSYEVVTGTYDLAPAGNGTHTSTFAGDAFTFTFAGTTINVYGIMSWGSTGSVKASFSVDGYSTSQTFTANTAANNGLTNSTNYPFYSNTSLSSGNHTLTVNVTSVSGNLPFIIDYLTYQPNFDNIDSKPNFTAQAGIGSSTGPDSNPGSSAGSTSSDTTSKSHAGAIAGGVIGGLLAIAAILGGILLWRRRSRFDKPKYSARGRANVLDSNERLMVETPGNILYPMQHLAQDLKSVSGPPKALSTEMHSGSDYTSASGATTPTAPGSDSSRPLTVNEKQTELRRRLDEIASLMQQMEVQTSADSSSSAPVKGSGDSNVLDLQARIDRLTRENERLMETYVVPPAYEGVEGTTTTGESVLGEHVPGNARNEKRILRLAYEPRDSE
ncbi:hypothetical protein HHX47_DHR4000260 [Lentinula edodes]|nr:hypothetical protein HHX47_DHR4000260 [Lentinula edodes]